MLDAPLRRSLLALGAIGAGLLLLSGLGAWLLSRRLERALRAATAAAEALAQGSAPVLAPSRVRELERLGEALQHSARLLEEREQERDAHLVAAEAARAGGGGGDAGEGRVPRDAGARAAQPAGPHRQLAGGAAAARRRRDTPEREVIARQLRHVVRMVDDLLDVARITRGQM